METRYIYEVFRSTPKALLFAQALFGFELASADPRVVAINLVGEEDEHTSMTDYADHMRIVGYLRTLYPKVRVSLHAGELAPGLVPPEGLCCHIRLAVEQAKADRIGHGVDVMYEDRPYELMKDMAAKRVMVEINLTSNDVILGIKGKHHPFSLYRKFGVPVALSTDDEGISRIDLTHEYVRAVETYGLSYADLEASGAQQSRIQLPARCEPGRLRLRSPGERLRERRRRREAVLHLRCVPQGKREGGAAMGA